MVPSFAASSCKISAALQHALHSRLGMWPNRLSSAARPHENSRVHAEKGMSGLAPLHSRGQTLNVEPEVHDIAFAHDVLFSLEARVP